MPSNFTFIPGEHTVSPMEKMPGSNTPIISPPQAFSIIFLSLAIICCGWESRTSFCPFNIAKHNNLILNSDKFNEVLTSYKDDLKKEFRNIFKRRIDIIKDNYSKMDDDKPLELVKNLKKELVKFNKDAKKEEKQVLTSLVKEKLVSNLDLIVKDSNPNFKKDATKFLQTTYVKQILETVDMKILVKDTILLNSLKEQIERFVFTKENSHLFD